MIKPGFLWLVFVLLGFAASTGAEPVKGLYGVPTVERTDPNTYFSRLKEAGVNAVFVPPEEKTIKWFKGKGFHVYLSVNAFGGKGAWKKYPDSRPVKSDGSYLGSEPGYKGHGGVCPTHTGWRQERLKYVESLVREFGGEHGIDGIWLDFIRYPGLWEVPEAKIPDTCYCPRCLAEFQQDTGINIPSGLDTEGSAAWIKGNTLYEWMKWKKEQIASFVSEVRNVMEKNQGKKPLKLGLFLVPWTKGERGDAISYLLAQDPFQLAAVADVISPMVYHKMCGKSAEWVGYMTRYYKETAPSEVWPIVEAQSAESKVQDERRKGHSEEGSVEEELGNAVRFAGQGGADGVLVYSFKGMRPGMWIAMKDFQELPNLMINSLTQRRKGAKGVAVTAKDEWGVEWLLPLADCEAGDEYQFRAEFYRDGWRNGVYPEVSLWGKEFRVDTHLKAKVWQPIRVNVVCPDEVKDPNFRFINRNRGTTFTLRSPSVKRMYRFRGEPELVVERGFFKGDFFPIGVYGAGLENLEQIKRLAINTVILGGRGANLKKKVEKCHEVGLRYVLSVPHDPDQLPVFSNEISEYVRPHDLAFYVNDEPGIWSFPVNRANDINRLIKDRFPGCATCMAVVRPQICRDFEWAADFFMLDQYPVPYMPMTWLSESLDRAADEVGPDRLASIIQAFGGEKYADVGWPRLPTWQEMDCLAFLSIVHGSRAVFFFTYSTIGKTKQGRESLGRVVGRLNRIYPWLLEENLDLPVKIEMISSNRLNSKGRPAVQCCVKRKGDERLLIAVNTIGTYVEAELSAERRGHSGKRMAREVFSGEDYRLVNGKIRVKFGPYETKAFLSADYAE